MAPQPDEKQPLLAKIKQLSDEEARKALEKMSQEDIQRLAVSMLTTVYAYTEDLTCGLFKPWYYNSATGFMEALSRFSKVRRGDGWGEFSPMEQVSLSTQDKAGVIVTVLAYMDYLNTANFACVLRAWLAATLNGERINGVDNAKDMGNKFEKFRTVLKAPLSAAAASIQEIAKIGSNIGRGSKCLGNSIELALAQELFKKQDEKLIK